MGRSARSLLALTLITVLLLGTTGCIAGTGRYSEEKPANFWSGLFHGLLSPITLLISLFTGAIDMYERFNVGWGYDFGYFIGIAIILGGGVGSRSKWCRVAWRRKRSRDWDTLGDEIEREIKQGLREWFSERRGAQEGADADEESWTVIGRKIEEKIKRRLKEWAEKD